MNTNTRLAIAFTASVALNTILFGIIEQDKKELKKAKRLIIYCADMLKKSGYEFSEFDFLAFEAMGVPLRREPEKEKDD